MTDRIPDRRTFLRRIGALGGVAAVSGLAGCFDGVHVADTDDPAADPGELRPGMETGMVFTGFGGTAVRSEVDPDQPGGGRLIAVDTVDPGRQVTFDWREAVEREITPTGTPQTGVGTSTPTPEVEVVERTGTITASGLAGAHESLLPMFWESGETTTETSAMWLTREAFRELAETRRTAWSPDVLTRISWVGKAAQERIHSAVEEVDEEEVYLEAEAEFVEFELAVDGQDASVRAIRAHDSFGNEYVILANEENPLVVKFTYDAVSVGLTGFDSALWSLIKAVYSGYRVLSIATA